MNIEAVIYSCDQSWIFSRKSVTWSTNVELLNIFVENVILF